MVEASEKVGLRYMKTMVDKRMRMNEQQYLLSEMHNEDCIGLSRVSRLPDQLQYDEYRCTYFCILSLTLQLILQILKRISIYKIYPDWYTSGSELLPSLICKRTNLCQSPQY